MQPLVVASNPDGDVKKFAKPRRREQFFSRSVRNNSPLAHQNHSLDLGQDVSKMMSHEDEARAFPCETPKGFTQIALRSEIESI